MELLLKQDSWGLLDEGSRSDALVLGVDCVDLAVRGRLCEERGDEKLREADEGLAQTWHRGRVGAV